MNNCDIVFPLAFMIGQKRNFLPLDSMACSNAHLCLERRATAEIENLKKFARGYEGNLQKMTNK